MTSNDLHIIEPTPMIFGRDLSRQKSEESCNRNRHDITENIKIIAATSKSLRYRRATISLS